MPLWQTIGRVAAFARVTCVVMLGLVPGIQPAPSAGASGEMVPATPPFDDARGNAEALLEMTRAGVKIAL